MITADTDVQGLPALATYEQTAKWAGCTTRHLVNLVKAGRFPAPIYFGERSPRFRRSDLLNHLEAQAAAVQS